MKLCRFQEPGQAPRIGLILENAAVLDLSVAGIASLTALLEAQNLLPQLSALASQNLPRFDLADLRLLAPLERQEVWAVLRPPNSTSQPRAEAGGPDPNKGKYQVDTCTARE